METNRGEIVIVPTEPLLGMLKPLPMRMTSPSDERWSPWLLVMMRTSWPRNRRFSYRKRTCSLTPPGIG